MLNKSIDLFGLFLLLALVACSGENYATGTVDPNANPQTASGDDYSSSSSSVRDSEMNGESSSSSQVFSTDTNNEDGVVTIVFKTAVTEVYSITVEKSVGSVVSNDGQIAVYAAEKGATAVCGDDNKSYLGKFKIGSDNRIEKTIELKNYGAACDGFLEIFKASCDIANVNDQLSGACDDNGNLDVYCAYSDETIDFKSLLDDFTSESESICNDSGFKLHVVND